MEKRRGTRADYRYLLAIPTRWADLDAYAHVNNVVYYAYFDTVVGDYLVRHGALSIATSPVIGLVVETGCRFFAPITFPDIVTAGLRVSRLGNTSVRYEIGIFRNDEEVASAEGHFVHVYVDRETQKLPTPLPPILREILTPLAVSA